MISFLNILVPNHPRSQLATYKFVLTPFAKVNVLMKNLSCSLPSDSSTSKTGDVVRKWKESSRILTSDCFKSMCYSSLVMKQLCVFDVGCYSTKESSKFMVLFDV